MAIHEHTGDRSFRLFFDSRMPSNLASAGAKKTFVLIFPPVWNIVARLFPEGWNRICVSELLSKLLLNSCPDVAQIWKVLDEGVAIPKTSWEYTNEWQWRAGAYSAENVTRVPVTVRCRMCHWPHSGTVYSVGKNQNAKCVLYTDADRRIENFCFWKLSFSAFRNQCKIDLTFMGTNAREISRRQMGYLRTAK